MFTIFQQPLLKLEQCLEEGIMLEEFSTNKNNFVISPNYRHILKSLWSDCERAPTAL